MLCSKTMSSVKKSTRAGAICRYFAVASVALCILAGHAHSSAETVPKYTSIPELEETNVQEEFSANLRQNTISGDAARSAIRNMKSSSSSSSSTSSSSSSSASTSGATTCLVLDDSLFSSQSDSLQCAPGEVISDILFASYGSPSGSCDSPDSMQIDSSCHSPLTGFIVRQQCWGQNSCKLKASSKSFPGASCGFLSRKALVVNVKCRKLNPCAAAKDGSEASVTCPTGHLVSKVNFASYGTPSGSCSSSSSPQKGSCHADNSSSIVESLCIGRSSCSVSASSDIFGSPCSDIKSLVYSVSCAPAEYLTVVGESKATDFACPSADSVVSSVNFASYGTPTITGANFSIGQCNAQTSVSTVTEACLNKNTCVLSASNDIFPDPCPGTEKMLGTSMTCQTLTSQCYGAFGAMTPPGSLPNLCQCATKAFGSGDSKSNSMAPAFGSCVDQNMESMCASSPQDAGYSGDKSDTYCSCIKDETSTAIKSAQGSFSTSINKCTALALAAADQDSSKDSGGASANSPSKAKQPTSSVPNSDQNNVSSGGGLSKVALGGIIAGAVVGVGLLIFVVVKLIQWKKDRDDDGDDDYYGRGQPSATAALAKPDVYQTGVARGSTGTVLQRGESNGWQHHYLSSQPPPPAESFPGSAFSAESAEALPATSNQFRGSVSSQPQSATNTAAPPRMPVHLDGRDLGASESSLMSADDSITSIKFDSIAKSDKFDSSLVSSSRSFRPDDNRGSGASRDSIEL